MAHAEEGGFGDSRYRFSATQSSGTVNHSVVWFDYPLGHNIKPFTSHERRAAKAYDLMCRVCGLTGHLGTCGVTSDRYRFNIKIGSRSLAIPNPLYPMWVYILMHRG